MDRRTLVGNSDLTISVVGLGCNNFGGRLSRADSLAVIHAAIDHGIDFFDTAPSYAAGQSEALLGEALVGNRHRLVIASKFGYPDHATATSGRASRAAITAALDASLQRLRTDWIDLYQLHVPDPSTPLEETLTTLDALQRSGKVRWVGASNLDHQQVLESDDLARASGLQGFVTHQNELSLLRPALARSLLPHIRRRNLGFLPYFPLAGGALTGKYLAGQPLPVGSRLSSHEGFRARHLTERDLQLVGVLDDYARSRDRSLLQLAFSWLAAHSEVRSVIAGASSVDQVRANIDAADWHMTEAEMAQIEAIVAPGSTHPDLIGEAAPTGSR